MYRSFFYLSLLALSLLSAPSVLAEVVLSTPGGIEVTQEDIERYITENVPAEQKEAILMRAGIFREMAESLYVMRLLAAEAAAEPDFDEMQAAWAAKMTYRRRLVLEYRAQYVRRALADADWEASAREVYLAEADRFMAAEQVRASHILITAEQRSDEEALQLATTLRARIIGGEDFSTLAMEYTDDPSGKNNGGDLGFFGRGKMVESFDSAVFAMKDKGEISEIVKSPFGYHIIRLEERKPAEKRPFAEVQNEIISEIQTQMGNQVWQDKIIATRSNRNIQINEESLQETRSKYVKPAEPE